MSITPGRPHGGNGDGGRSRGRGGRPRDHRPSASQSPQRQQPSKPDVTPAAPSPPGPPSPPRELDGDPTERRTFDVADTAWIAWVAGKSAWGSGGYGLGMVVAVHFALASAPDRPMREALLARGRFAGLYDEELRALFERSVAIVHEQQKAEPSRRERRSRDW